MEIGFDFGVGVLLQESGIDDLEEPLKTMTYRKASSIPPFLLTFLASMGGMHLRRVAHNGRTIGLGGKLELSGESGP